ncbi:hypothetical protein LY76DRAFT_243094 [Colletotrichum caudatum]|nr:hypothetical protein LY76DRAFT_243094 [Colletotrichum caudatum]
MRYGSLSMDAVAQSRPTVDCCCCVVGFSFVFHPSLLSTPLSHTLSPSFLLSLSSPCVSCRPSGATHPPSSEEAGCRWSAYRMK